MMSQTAQFVAGGFVIVDDNQGEIVPGVITTYIYEIASSTFNGTPATEITLVDTSVNTASNKARIGIYGVVAPTAANVSIGGYSHAEGLETQALGEFSHAAGNNNRALGYYQSVVGQWNQPISQPSAFIVGDGVDDTTRHNLLVADSGSVVISGSLLVSGSITSTNGGITKNNAISNTSFGGTPLSASVTFATAFPNTSYSIAVTGEDARAWSIQSKTAAGFTVNSNSSVALIGDTYWQATSYGEFNG